ncbi:hypothetical protein [Falsiroseomonas sp. HW251]|uniref:hypothetical protein n=1 Tax=Falsiroseomonas sp. HW251 TaxID=3390998 RepID=UPI003D3173E1
MSHAVTASVFPGFAAGAGRVPPDLSIPRPPRVPFVRWIPAARREPAWREALRWSLIGLTASWAAGEATLRLAGL